MNWKKEVTQHRVEEDGKVTTDYTGVFTRYDGTTVTARRASDSAEISFTVRPVNPDMLGDQTINLIAEAFLRAFMMTPAGEDLLRKLDVSVDRLDLSIRAANCLRHLDVRYIGQLVQKSEEQMLELKSCSRGSLKEIKDAIARMGLTFSMNVDGWSPPMPAV